MGQASDSECLVPSSVTATGSLSRGHPSGFWVVGQFDGEGGLGSGQRPNDGDDGQSGHQDRCEDRGDYHERQEGIARRADEVVLVVQPNHVQIPYRFGRSPATGWTWR